MQLANRGLDSMAFRTPWHFRAAGMSGLLSASPVDVQEAHEYNRAIQVCNTDFYWTLVTSSYCVSYRRLAIKLPHDVLVNPIHDDSHYLQLVYTSNDITCLSCYECDTLLTCYVCTACHVCWVDLSAETYCLRHLATLHVQNESDHVDCTKQTSVCRQGYVACPQWVWPCWLYKRNISL